VIRVQTGDFDIGKEIESLRADRTDIGAIVTFSGTVRDAQRDDGGAVTEMTLEHYPGMTEKELARIEEEAQTRWPLQASGGSHVFEISLGQIDQTDASDHHAHTPGTANRP